MAADPHAVIPVHLIREWKWIGIHVHGCTSYLLVICITNCDSVNEPPHDKTNKMACAPSEDSAQRGHLSSLISLRCPYEESLDP